MNWEELWNSLPLQAWRLLDLALAVILGFLIGLERKHRSKDAGIRTHTIVSVGAALFTIVSKFGFGAEADAARVAAQIVSGIGFLGAGIIMFRKREVYGLTTAAGLWATAGVGMACGAQMHLVAIGAAALIIAAQCILHINCKLFRMKQYYIFRIEFEKVEGSVEIIKSHFCTDRFNKLVIEREQDKIIYSALLKTEKEFSSNQLGELMTEYPFIRELERRDGEVE